MIKTTDSKKFKQGGVSMFIVVASCLVISVIVASFIRLAIRDQSQASLQDISQSAYDSSQAGVEDAKRFLNVYSAECGGGNNLISDKCQKMHNALYNDSGNCNILGTANIASASGETQIQTNVSVDSQLNQAYTCVKIEKNTADFLGKIQAGEAHTVPLNGVADFRKVRISWHSTDDLSNPSTNAIDLENVIANPRNAKFYDQTTWQNKTNRPAVIKTQFFGYRAGTNISSETFDQSYAGNGAVGLDEMILYPARTGSVSRNSYNLVNGTRRTSSGTTEPTVVSCKADLNDGGYACSVAIDLGVNIAKGTNISFLRLTSIYTASSFKVELLNSANGVIAFDGVQPKIDSTGRANDAFRRVESRVEYVDPNFPQPSFTLQSEDRICKDFWVTNMRNGGNLNCTE